MPVVYRTTGGSTALQTYGVAANIIGRGNPGWQTNSGSLWFDARWMDLWRKIAESGTDHGEKITIVSPSIEGAKKKWAGLCQRPVISQWIDIG